ncbi:MAG: ribonuclease Z [Nitrospirota bacterium]
MKPSFHVRPFNGPFEDPGLYIRFLREGRAMIFDLGFTTALSSRDILKTSDIFVSHTHIDHFIGFDNVLRTCLKKESPLKLYGPAGFTDCVEGKLRSYTWNLIEDYPIVVEVHEVDNASVKQTVFRAEHSFAREEKGAGSFSGILFKDPVYTVRAVSLDHGIPCMAFSLEEDCHINIDKAGLISMGLSVGPWLRQLKTAVRENRQDSVFTIEGRAYTFSELKGLADVTRGQKISYVVDAIGSEQNMKKIVELAKGSDILYIETYFLDEDKDRARDRCHLTAMEAGRIAREAGVGRLEAVHFSPRYMDEPQRLYQEAREAFAK